MSGEELIGWYAYYRVEPFGTAADECRDALIGTAVCNSMGAKIKPKDLVPDWEAEEKKNVMSYEAFAMMTRLAGGKVKKKR